MSQPIQNCFERYEKKYFLTPAGQKALLQIIAPYIKMYFYGKYTICNLYYDTPDWRLIRASLEKPVYKEKLRVRSYGVPAPDFGEQKTAARVLKITIPENLDYDGLFDDIFAQYTRRCTLTRVKTSNMGTLYELEYAVLLPENVPPKAFLDALRCRNGNLNITCGRESSPGMELL